MRNVIAIITLPILAVLLSLYQTEYMSRGTTLSPPEEVVGKSNYVGDCNSNLLWDRSPEDTGQVEYIVEWVWDGGKVQRIHSNIPSTVIDFPCDKTIGVRVGAKWKDKKIVNFSEIKYLNVSKNKPTLLKNMVIGESGNVQIGTDTLKSLMRTSRSGITDDTIKGSIQYTNSGTFDDYIEDSSID